MRARLAILLAGSVALGGCAYGFGDYGSYGGLSVGVGSGYGYGGYGGYYDPYGYDGYGGYPYGAYGGGYGMPYYGWYDNYYYPGSGVYVYDSYRRPHVWSDRQQRYWIDRRNRVERHDRDHDRDRTQVTTRTQVRENWSGFDRRDNAIRSDRRSTRPQRSDSERPR